MVKQRDVNEKDVLDAHVGYQYISLGTKLSTAIQDISTKSCNVVLKF